jgi:hypothetical protein
MIAELRNFLIADETGAVTVDWVVLTAAVIGLGMVVLLPIAYSADNVSEQIGGGIGERQVGYQQQN